MIGARVARLVSALALIAGLLGMHALVVVEHVGEPTGTVSSATAMRPSPPAPMTAGHDVAAPTDDRPVMPHGAVPGHTPDHGAHQTLHLCLAVLAALLLLVAFAGLAWSFRRSDVTAARVALRTGRRAPPRRPPPTSVRLAQLCVMRN